MNQQQLQNADLEAKVGTGSSKSACHQGEVLYLVGKAIQNLLSSRELSESELGRKLDVPASAIQAIEKGTSADLTVGDLARLCQALGSSLSDLLASVTEEPTAHVAPQDSDLDKLEHLPGLREIAETLSRSPDSLCVALAQTRAGERLVTVVRSGRVIHHGKDRRRQARRQTFDHDLSELLEER